MLPQPIGLARKETPNIPAGEFVEEGMVIMKFVHGAEADFLAMCEEQLLEMKSVQHIPLNARTTNHNIRISR